MLQHFLNVCIIFLYYWLWHIDKFIFHFLFWKFCLTFVFHNPYRCLGFPHPLNFLINEQLCYFLDSMIAAVKPKPPAKHVRDGPEEDDDDDLVINEWIVNSCMELKDGTCLFVKHDHFSPFGLWNVEISASTFNQWMEENFVYFSAWQVKATW